MVTGKKAAVNTIIFSTISQMRMNSRKTRTGFFFFKAKTIAGRDNLVSQSKYM
jgi:hypothetical protein